MERELKRQSEAQKDWLVDGVDNLGKTSESGDRAKDDRGDTLKLTVDNQTDRRDQNYLLKLFTTQKRAADAKPGPTKSTTGQSDPFAPFLQDWLGTSSPVRGKFFDEFVRKSDTGNVTGVSIGSVEQDNRQSLGAVDLGLGVPDSERANPYLQGMDAPTATELSGSRSQVNPVVFGLDNTASRSSPDRPQPPIALERPAEKKTPWLAPSDDKKYYPQLKKF